MSPQSEDDIFADSGGWAVVHRVSDEWELTLIRAAYVHAEIPFKLQSMTAESGERQMALAVPVEREEEAVDLLLRVVQVVDHDGDDANAADEARDTQEEEPLVRATPADSPIRTLAEREGFGEIVYREGFGYELRVGPEPYAVVLEEDWEGFTDLSAQRTEFGILLKNDYKDLYNWLRAERKLGDFLRLVESTYRGPMGMDTPWDLLRGAAWMVAAIAAIALLLFLVRWLQGPVPPVAG